MPLTLPDGGQLPPLPPPTPKWKGPRLYPVTHPLDRGEACIPGGGQTCPGHPAAGDSTWTEPPGPSQAPARTSPAALTTRALGGHAVQEQAPVPSALGGSAGAGHPQKHVSEVTASAGGRTRGPNADKPCGHLRPFSVATSDAWCSPSSLWAKHCSRRLSVHVTLSGDVSVSETLPEYGPP